MLKIKKIFANANERLKGLNSLEEPLKEDECVLFVFPFETTNSFWNKGVPYDIDIAFFDSNKRLIYKTSMKANQYKKVNPEKPYKYVVEANVGKLKNISELQ